MRKCINFGEYNKYYKYIILSCIFNYLTDYVDSGTLSKDLNSLKIINNDNQSLFEHSVIFDCFNFIGIFIISFILYKFKGQNIDSSFEISHKNDKEEEKNKFLSYLNLSLLLSFWIIIDHITNIIYSLMIFDYWMFELLFVSLIYSKLYKIKIYNHQKLGIIINSISSIIFRIINFCILANQRDDNYEDFNIKYKWFIPISIIIYLSIIISTSYIFTKLKFYTDLKFISPIKLLIIYGILGFVISSISCVIETSFKCIGKLKEYFCRIVEYSENEENYDIYIDNLFIFFKEFSFLDSKDITFEIIIILFMMIFNFFSKYFDILVIIYLTPMHFLFSSLVYVFFKDLIELIRYIIEKKGKIADNDLYNYKEALLNILLYFFSFIGFMIFLEIIELNFCKLNYDLRKYIIERGISDINQSEINESIINNEENSLLNNNVELPINETKKLY